jgi:hypothetical protein
MSWSNKITKRLINYGHEGSPAFRFRKKRARILKNLISEIYAEHGKVDVIDIGGTREYWRIIPDSFLLEHHIKITLVNIYPQQETPQTDIFEFVQGDGRNLSQFPDQTFHLAHSNSVIEHVGDFNDMERFAGEIHRVTRHHFVQTPNYWFPVEPHLVFPFFQFLPKKIRIWLIMHFSLGWWQKTADAAFARKRVESIRLLTRREFQQLFPESTIYPERFAFMVKSFIAVR